MKQKIEIKTMELFAILWYTAMAAWILFVVYCIWTFIIAGLRALLT